MAAPTLDAIRASFPSEEQYSENREALKDFLCLYFELGGCTQNLHKSISPVGGCPDGSKVLKVRWNVPGQGKRGGLRLITLAHCERLRVRIAGAWVRKEDPSDAEVAAAVDEGS